MNDRKSFIIQFVYVVQNILLLSHGSRGQVVSRLAKIRVQILPKYISIYSRSCLKRTKINGKRPEWSFYKNELFSFLNEQAAKLVANIKVEVVDKSDPPKTGDEFQYELNMLYDQLQKSYSSAYASHYLDVAYQYCLQKPILTCSQNLM